jgi:hypothetical protein
MTDPDIEDATIDTRGPLWPWFILALIAMILTWLHYANA